MHRSYALFHVGSQNGIVTSDLGNGLRLAETSMCISVSHRTSWRVLQDSVHGSDCFLHPIPADDLEILSRDAEKHAALLVKLALSKTSLTVTDKQILEVSLSSLRNNAK